MLVGKCVSIVTCPVAASDFLCCDVGDEITLGAGLGVASPPPPPMAWAAEGELQGTHQGPGPAHLGLLSPVSCLHCKMSTSVTKSCLEKRAPGPGQLGPSLPPTSAAGARLGGQSSVTC